MGGEIHADGGKGGNGRNGGNNGGGGSGGRIFIESISYPQVYVSGTDMITSYGGRGCNNIESVAQFGTVIAFCGQGYEIGSISCKICGPGTYSQFGIVCRSCPNGAYSNISGASISMK